MLREKHPGVVPEKLNGFMNAIEESANTGHLTNAELVNICGSTALRTVRSFGGDVSEMEAIISCVAEALKVKVTIGKAVNEKS